MRCSAAIVVLSLSVVACSSGRSSAPTVFAAATIGADGGVIEVAAGEQAGLRIVVPAGALAQPVELRVVDVDVGDLLPLVQTPVPAQPFRVEPADLYFELPVTLRLPYEPARVQWTGPGNVRVRQTRSTGTIEHPPEAVDALAGFAQISLRTIGRFEVTIAAPTIVVLDYLGAEASVTLADGWSLTSGAVPAGSPFAGPEASQWRLQGPGLDETWVFDTRQLRARETTAWRETWLQPVLLWDDARYGLVAATTTATQVAAPIGISPLGGTIAASHFWKYDLPRSFAGQLFTDVARFDVTLAWNRHDLGTGQRQHTSGSRRGVGLLAMAIDGVVHERTAP